MKFKLVNVVFWSAWSVALILLPSQALAWGPGAHIECSTFLLKHLVLLAPAIKKLISAYSQEFTYGSLCPDMVLGKRYMKPEHNNHQWSVGFNILDSAQDPAQRAFAFGYLSHLAADTVAHNIFIPDQLLDRYDIRRQGHMTYEMLFDMTLDDNVWETARMLSRRPFRQCTSLMIGNLPRTPLPGRVNHAIFRSGALLVRVGGWQRIVNNMRKHWEKIVDRAAAKVYLNKVHDTVIEFLNDPMSASCRNQCPTGGEVLTEAENLRVTLKRLNRNSLLKPEWYHGLVFDFQNWREQSFINDNCFSMSPIIAA